MFGLEEDKKKKEKFAFDLEKQIQSDANFTKSLTKKAEDRIAEVKKLLREGANEKEFDRLGVLLNGYTALQKVIKKVVK